MAPSYVRELRRTGPQSSKLQTTAEGGRDECRACEKEAEGRPYGVPFFAQQFTDPMAEFVVDCSLKQDREFMSSVIGSL